MYCDCSSALICAQEYILLSFFPSDKMCWITKNKTKNFSKLLILNSCSIIEIEKSVYFVRQKNFDLEQYQPNSRKTGKGMRSKRVSIVFATTFIVLIWLSKFFLFLVHFKIRYSI